MRPYRKRRVRIVFIIALIFTVAIVGYAGELAILSAVQGRSALSVMYEDMLSTYLSGQKKYDPSNTARIIEKRRKANEKYVVPLQYKLVYGFNTEVFEGFEVCYFGEESAELDIFYLHGGAFMYQPLLFHYDYCRYLAKKLNARIVMPVYPKAPKYGYMEVITWLDKFYDTLDGDFIFMGDSAGGSLVISLSQYLLDNGKKPPELMFTFSPCFDLSMSNEEMHEFDKLDPMLGVEDLRQKLVTYVKDGDFKNPYASPAYCDYEKLGQLILFSGDREILVADARRMAEYLEDVNGFQYYEFPFMNHVFPIYPMPERDECLEIIQTVLKEAKANFEKGK